MKPGRLMILVVCVLFAGICRVSFGNICWTTGPDDVVACEPRNVSKDACLAMGCCWNDTAVNSSCYRSKRLNGTCIPYPEHGLCFQYLNKSIPKFRNTPRFVDYKIGFNKTEFYMGKFQQLVTIIAKDESSQTCLEKIRILLCQYVLTPCSDDGIPIQICRRDCEQFEMECPKTLQKLLGGARVSLESTKTDFVHIDLPDCKNLKTEKELKRSGRQCYVSGLFSHIDPTSTPPTTSNATPPPPAAPPSSSSPASPAKGEQKSKTLVIMVSAIVPVVLIILGVTVCLLLRRRRRNKKAHSKHEHGTPTSSHRPLGNFPSISVKDHINKLCADDLLKSKMSITNPKEIKQYPVDMIAYEKDLGEGQFGQVFQGRAIGLNEDEPEGETIVAVKTLKKGSSSETKAEFDQEALLMNYLSHPNIVQLLAVSAMEEPYCMIFEFMSKGDLSEYLRKSEPVPEHKTETLEEEKNYLSQETLIKMCVDVANGLQFLASNRLIHRDVATRNCLVADDLTIKIADFGMSRDIYSNNYYKIERETVLPIRWLSPEAVLFGKFTVQSDVYSYGVLLWEVFTFSMQPYYGYTNKEVLEFISKGVHLAKPDYCPGFVYKIMKDCWARNPELRPQYQSILDRLHGKEAAYDTPRIWPANENLDPALYQNVPLRENGNDANSEIGDGHAEPLIISMTPPGESSADTDGVFMAKNPLYKVRNEAPPSHASGGSTNGAIDSDFETGDVPKGSGENLRLKQTNLREESNFNRINKTYV